MKRFLLLFLVSVVIISTANSTQQEINYTSISMVDTLPKQNPDTMHKGWNDMQGRKPIKDTLKKDTTSKVPPQL